MTDYTWEKENVSCNVSLNKNSPFPFVYRLAATCMGRIKFFVDRPLNSKDE